MSSATITPGTMGDANIELPESYHNESLCDKSNLLHSRASALTCPTASTITESGSQSSLTSSDDDEANQVVDGHGGNNNHASEYFSEARITRMNSRAEEENERLNLNLGLPVDLTVYTKPEDTTSGIVQKALRMPIQVLLRVFDRLLSWIESPLFHFCSERIPLRLRQKITFMAWGLYLPIHKALVGRRTGLHRDVSLEYHALTSVMWWGRLFPITVKRMRFSLSQLHASHPPDRYPKWNTLPGNKLAILDKPHNGEKHGLRGHLHEVYHQMEQKRTPTGMFHPTTKAASTDMIVTGKYIQQSSKPSQKVIFWIYGGAFLAGDSKGNMGIAEKMGMMCAGEGEDSGARDVFVPDYRLVPEYHLDDAVHDIVLAFEYLIYERGVKPENITLVGVSSGGGLVVLLMQALAKAKQEAEEMNGASSGEGDTECVPMPAGGVMMGPFVDYTHPMGSMKEYIKHDLIVNQSVFDGNIHYLEQVLGSHENRVRASPVYGDFEGLPPLCICVSEHEVVYDQTMLLAKRAKEQGVDVTIGVWKYMCHVFPLLCTFVPEGQESFNFMCEWVKKH